MKSVFLLPFTTFILLSSLTYADTTLIHTTVADSSNVSFIARTPLSWETVEHDSLRYIRFTDIPVADCVGYPEVPVITCLVAVPDSVIPCIEFAFTSENQQSVLPVYPAPAQIVSYEYTPAIVDSFVMDSTAYSSTSFWPAERVRLIGETRLCHQRLLKIQLFPAQYRAADSTLSTVTSFSVSVSFDSSEAEWSSIGLGAFQRMVEGSPIVGYHAVPQTYAPIPDYFGVVDPYNGPPAPNRRMPDYVIICASGLYDDCSDAIDELAEHRVSLNQFDVATVLTDDILVDFGEDQSVITDDIIRDFTEHMWENWPQASTKSPSYLLLIGDHEDSSYGSADWFLPTHVYDDYILPDTPVYNVGNDEWYAYFNGDRNINNDMPCIMLGRISVKNGGTAQTDTLSAIIVNLIDIETPITQIPISDNRRVISRLAGTGHDNGYGYQTYTNWSPSKEWTSDFAEWLNYGYITNYCGDGRDFIDKDGSLMASWEWRSRCLAEYERGAGVIFYSNHGDYHMFSAGLEWLPQYIPLDPYTKGARDSTFNNYQVENSLSSSTGHAAPFTLLLCCSSGTYNHTVTQHQERQVWPELCFYDGSDSPPVPAYDFGTDCLGEKLQKNTSAPVAGVFCGSQSSSAGCYSTYGTGILEAIYVQGRGRLGDAIMTSRMNNEGSFLSIDGDGAVSLGQFNLLGDPALDISDYVRFPNHCDLVVYQDYLQVSPYPVETSSGAELEIAFTVRNNGRQNSDSFSAKITITDGSDTSTDYVSCAAINSGNEEDYGYTWACPIWFDTPVELEVTIEADYQHNCDDSWWGNNTATETIQLNDIYPFDPGWPVEIYGSLATTPLLVNLDSDSYLEVVALNGNHLTAFDYDGTELWTVNNENFVGEHPITADLDQDGDYEIIVAYHDGIKTISNTGTILDELETTNAVFAVGDMHSRNGLELCTADYNILYLYNWDSSQSGFSLIASKDLGFTRDRPAISLVCGDLGGDSYDDVAYLNGFSAGTVPAPPQRSSVSVYDWSGSSMLYSHTWNEYLIPGVALSAGELAGTSAVGFPLGEFQTTGDPARLIEPDETVTEVSCSNTNVLNAKHLLCGVFADWTAATGADAFVLPSERQCMAWDVDGDRLSGWPTQEFSGASEGSGISPTALGNLDGTNNDDVLFSTELNGDWVLLAYDSDGYPLSTTLDFPYTLPEGATAQGGFAVGDLDRDGNVEIVFGTDDGLLHCWELGTCSTGYAPWPQFQHDSGRSGVLE